MSDGTSSATKVPYVRPTLSTYGDFASLTAAGSGIDTEIFPDPSGQNMMRRP